MEKQTSDLYWILQGEKETFRDYLYRFNKEKVFIPISDIGTAKEAFRQGLVRDLELYIELTRYPYSTFEDVQAKALTQIKVEEDIPFRVRSVETDRTSRRGLVHRGS
ncbi:hypothetical protein vseg_013321 [Gypsophila vaccaria]